MVDLYSSTSFFSFRPIEDILVRLFYFVYVTSMQFAIFQYGREVLVKTRGRERERRSRKKGAEKTFCVCGRSRETAKKRKRTNSGGLLASSKE